MVTTSTSHIHNKEGLIDSFNLGAKNDLLPLHCYVFYYVFFGPVTGLCLLV